MDIMDRPAQKEVVEGLETLEKHAYWRLSALVDDGRLDEAHDLVQLLQEVGLL